MNADLGRFSLIAVAALACASCATGPGPVGTAPGIQAIEGEMPIPAPADYTRPVRTYHVGPSDKLKVEVFGVPELGQEVQVDGSGRFAFPLIGTVEAAGRTPSEIAGDIETRLDGRYVRNPQVTVNVQESTTQTVTVDGQVARPGMYSVSGRMTLQRAVAVAGGTGEFAKLDDVVIQREVDGQTYIGLYNLGAIRRGNYADPEVYPSDLIVVGDSKQRRLMRDLLQAAGVAVSPLVILLQGSRN